MEVQNESEVKKPKRLTSVVWNHFERVKKGEICYAVCVHCNKKLSGSSNSGTTHLRNHLIRCLKRSNFDVSQLLAAKKRKKEGTLSLPSANFVDEQMKDGYVNVKPMTVIKFDQEAKKEEFMNLGSSKFDQERSRDDLARMIILHGYPIGMVDHVGFKVFVKNLQPMFEVMPNCEVELSCIKLYEEEKQKVYDTMKKLQGRVNLAVETWCSSEYASTEYPEFVCLTAHYVDEDWKLQKKILNFVKLESSNNFKLSEVIMKCLVDWGIDCKLFAMTFDDCDTNDDIVVRVKDQISENRPGQLYDVRSAAHLLNSIVQVAMEELRVVTQKIRESIRYVKSSQVTQAKFNEIAQEVGINSQRNLVLDCPTQWNTTFLMLESALEYKGAFFVFQDHDPTYKSALTETEWDWASSITDHLKLFLVVTKNFSSNKCPTANVYFPELCDVHLSLTESCKSTDAFISSTAMKMKAKFDKYWNKSSLALAVKTILDPRFKMKLVEYYYSQIYGSTALDRLKEVSDGLKELFNAYSISSALVDQGSASPGSSLPSTSYDTRDRLKGFDKFLHETSQSQSIGSDLEKYLEEPVFPRSCDFNILNWWKVHTPRYPILSMMARDVLGTPFSTVTPESAFRISGRVLDHYRSSLDSEICQALICSQDWLRTQPGESNQSALSLYVERLER